MQRWNIDEVTPLVILQDPDTLFGDASTSFLHSWCLCYLLKNILKSQWYKWLSNFYIFGCDCLKTLPAEHVVQDRCNGRVFIRQYRRQQRHICRRCTRQRTAVALLLPGADGKAGARYWSISAGDRAAAAGSVTLRGEMRGSTQTRFYCALV